MQTSSGSADAGALLSFALITLDGKATLCKVSGAIEVDTFGENYQAEFWKAVAQAVDPVHGRVNGFPLILWDEDSENSAENLRAKVIDLDEEAEAEHPVNAIATEMMRVLGGPERRVVGAMAIVAEEDPKTGLTPALSQLQMQHILSAHEHATELLRRPRW